MLPLILDISREKSRGFFVFVPSLAVSLFHDVYSIAILLFISKDSSLSSFIHCFYLRLSLTGFSPSWRPQLSDWGVCEPLKSHPHGLSQCGPRFRQPCPGARLCGPTPTAHRKCGECLRRARISTNRKDDAPAENTTPTLRPALHACSLRALSSCA